MDQRALRIVLAKIGLDGHDRGIKVVARGLRDAGFHVIYAGLWLTPEAVVRTVADEDADWLGLSILSGAHMTLVPRVLELLRASGLEHVGVIVGGIVPEADVPKLLNLGVARVFGPGTPIPEIVAFLRAAPRTRPAEAPASETTEQPQAASASAPAPAGDGNAVRQQSTAES
jgi:methylmalonyl-CoA mutase cobalamin-binding domain/chain